MTFTPKLKAYIRKFNHPINISAMIIFATCILILLYTLHWAIVMVFSHRFFVDFNIGFSNIVLFSAFGFLIAFIFKNNNTKTNKNLKRMENGNFKFDEIKDWNVSSLTTNLAKTIVSFKTSEAFNSKQDPSNIFFHTKFEKNDVLISIQTVENLTYKDILNKINKTFGTTPQEIKYHSATPNYMYEIKIHLADITWIENQDIIEYKLLES
ncbi:hypothetical protein QMA60_09375 [Leuconostoc suionicum]|uniref:hypothetical protein n=1 Tax=Leuconostoc TaxID=1243 RepID=UPI0024AD4BD9|nr:hypothetical protein [Leuconostoc suionicum]MDI6498876.1 hypothetical protein [Leuconostoc suionicum]MDI6500878.1 hypothetical protein [Leuconostoc suionicum]MDI6502418.1 hypothetical protein [Leuconostoc suionicum]MDI6665825.1 hypothetical protein [Leuconostoc suionicum]